MWKHDGVRLVLNQMIKNPILLQIQNCNQGKLSYFYPVKKIKLFYGLLFVVLLAVFSSCKEKTKAEVDPNIKGNYFSIKQFALDEWNTYSGESFVIIKSIRHDDKIDSSFTSSDTLYWGEIFKIFFETDISDRKFLGQYKFSQFDQEDGTHNLFYEALDDDLFTRKLLISIDNYSRKVKGIYIVTQKKSPFHEVLQKLYYSPLKEIQIQTDDKPLIGKKKFEVLTYDFMR